jgi:hypothetical protein
LPAKSFIEGQFSPAIEIQRLSFVDRSLIPLIVDQCRPKSDLDHDFVIHAILACGAAVFKPTYVSGFGECTNYFVFNNRPNNQVQSNVFKDWQLATD